MRSAHFWRYLGRVTLPRALAFALSFAACTSAAAPALAAPGEGAPPEDPAEVAAVASEEPPGQPSAGSPGRATDFRSLLHIEAGPLSVGPTALIQVQAMPYIGSDSYLQAGDAGERGGFRLRRARFGLEGRLYGAVPFMINAEFSSDDHGTARLHDAWFGYDKFKPVQVFVGARDVPFSRSALIDAGSGALIERPLAVRAMAPFHQLGISAEGRFFSGALNYAVGVYNGLQRTDLFFEGITENAAITGNRFDGLTYAGRLSTDPFGSLGPTMQDLNHDKFRLSIGGSIFYSRGGTRNILGAGGDVLLHYRGLHFLGEVLSSYVAPRTQPSQPTDFPALIQSVGVVGEVGYMILKRRLGVTARFEWLDPNIKTQDESDCWLLTGGLSYHLLRDLLKAQIDYTHRQEIHGQPLKNDSLVIQAQLNL